MADYLLKFPTTWSNSTIMFVCMLTLAALDFVGAYAASEWVSKRSNGMLVLGVTAFVILFWFYASSLQYAELAVVTFGWIVFLQIALVLLDRFHYGVEMPTGKWLAVGVLMAAQAYLILGPSGGAASNEAAPAEARVNVSQAGR